MKMRFLLARGVAGFEVPGAALHGALLGEKDQGVVKAASMEVSYQMGTKDPSLHFGIQIPMPASCGNGCGSRWHDGRSRRRQSRFCDRRRKRPRATRPPGKRLRGPHSLSCSTLFLEARSHRLSYRLRAAELAPAAAASRGRPAVLAADISCSFPQSSLRTQRCQGAWAPLAAVPDDRASRSNGGCR